MEQWYSTIPTKAYIPEWVKFADGLNFKAVKVESKILKTYFYIQ